jgi:hypothetical protein
MPYGSSLEVGKFFNDQSQRLIDNEVTAWDLESKAASTQKTLQELVTAKREEKEAMDPVAIANRKKKLEVELKNKTKEQEHQYAREGYGLVKAGDMPGFQKWWTDNALKAKESGDKVAMDIFDDPDTMSPERWRKEVAQVSEIGSFFENTPENAQTNAAEKFKGDQDIKNKTTFEDQAQAGRMDLQRLQNAGNLAVANARESDSGVTPLKSRTKELNDIKKLSGFGNKIAWQKASIPGIASYIDSIKPTLKNGDAAPAIDPEGEPLLTNSMADYVYRAVLAEFDRQSEAYKAGTTDTVPDINAIQDTIMEEMVTSGKIATKEGDWYGSENVWNPAGKAPPTAPAGKTPAPAGVEQSIWDNMDAEDKKAFQ